MRLLFFGTYDVGMHPRVQVLKEGFAALGHDVDEVNVPLGIDTAERILMLQRPWLAIRLLVTLASRWVQLAGRARRVAPADAVVVGYLGHFDVLLARWLFRDSVIVLDHLVSASDTARDRGVASPWKERVLEALDRAATRAADVVVVDTDEHVALLPEAARDRAFVVPVGAPSAWFAAGPGTDPAAPGWMESDPRGPRDLPAWIEADLEADPTASGWIGPDAARVDAAGAADPALEGLDRPLRAVFFGLYTPLQGTPVIAAALRLLHERDVPLNVTMIGRGQEYDEARAAAGDLPRVEWVPWVDPDRLPGVVASHDVCLGIFGTGPKARRVVPNKVFQGTAAGCALVTSDTAPQRALLGDAAVFVPPGDPEALADALEHLARDPERAGERGAQARVWAERHFRPAVVVQGLADHLTQALTPPAPRVNSEKTPHASSSRSFRDRDAGLRGEVPPRRGLFGRRARGPATLHVFLGTKAQYIKTAPLLRLLDERGVDYRLIDSGQHAALSPGLRDQLGVRAPDTVLGGDRDVNTIPQALGWTARLAGELVNRSRLRREVFGDAGGICVVHGDTPSTLLAALLARRAGLRVAHLEAGLRSHHLLHPFPEELIRVAVMHLSHLLFAPDDEAVRNLADMGVSGRVVRVSGNTVVEALARDLRGEVDPGAGPALVTMHRVENLNRPSRVTRFVELLERIAADQPVTFVVHGPTSETLARAGHLDRLRDAGVTLRPLLGHGEFVELLRRAPFVITDGGSIQEECALLGVPTLLWREHTERPDGIGRNVVVSRYDRQVVDDFLADPDRYRHPPTGMDQTPSAEILETLLGDLGTTRG